MPVVPMTRDALPTPGEAPSETNLLMSLAEMHRQNRIQVAQNVPPDTLESHGKVNPQEFLSATPSTAAGIGKTPHEEAVESFLQKNGLPEMTAQQRIQVIKSRIGQIAGDRRASTPPGEDLPPHGELFKLRARVRELQSGNGD